MTSKIRKNHEGGAECRFLSMFLGCLYSWLTIAATTDAELLSNSTSSQPPIIGGAVPILWFYGVVPSFLLLLYIYFHFSMRHLWELLANLPAEFPGGQPVDQKIYPRFLGGIVGSHCNPFTFKKGCPVWARVETFFFILLTWALVPVTPAAFGGRALPLRDWERWGMTSLLIVLIAIAEAVGLLFITWL
jgi:hypothetical protein